MKRKGFTLAEVLITLGIVGVVAALTAPALVQNAGNAKVGPTLAKVVATLENAHEQILQKEEASNLYSVAKTHTEYVKLLSEHVSGSSYENANSGSFTPQLSAYDKKSWKITNYNAFRLFNFSDNVTILVNSVYNNPSAFYSEKGSFKGCYTDIIVDINGAKTKPNVLGKDAFSFFVDRSGQVIPEGSSTYAWLTNTESFKYTNTSKGQYACNETQVTSGQGCAGSIFENNLKVIYQ